MRDFSALFTAAWQESLRVKSRLNELFPALQQAAEKIIASYRAGGKVMLCGNGGRAADAQHIAAELVGRFKQERPGYAALALSTNTSTLTAIGNDYAYDYVFARQVEAFGRPGDVLLAISTSGNAANVCRAAEVARGRGITVIALSGEGGGRLASLGNVLLAVPSKDTARVQECHITLGHLLCQAVEEALSGEGN